MGAMSRFTVRSLSQNKVRTVVTILGVALAAALLTAVMTSFSSLTNYLTEEEKATSGTWTAQITTGGAGEPSTEEAIQTARDSAEVQSWALITDAGFAQDPEGTSGYGHDLCLKTVEGDYQVTCGIAPSEGALPTTETEIMLPQIWKTTKGLSIGDTLTLTVGERQVAEVPVDSEMPLPDKGDPSYAVGDYLSSTDPIVDYAALGLQEKLVNTQSVTYTITGFYNTYNGALITGWGVQTGVVGKSVLALHKPCTELYLAIPHIETLTELSDEVHELYPQPEIAPNYHTALLRYSLVDTGGAIWDMFEGIVILLAVIIAVACISLIYNAFAISVAERSRQFGLLASIGASKRQLRLSIWLEGLIIAAIGIPLGIAIGLAGCAITFAYIGPMIEQALVGGDFSRCSFELSVDGFFLVAVTLLSLLVVFISVWIPALRASRVTAIEALRNVESVRIAPHAYKKLQRESAGESVWKQSGIAGRMFGIGGKVGSINHQRSAAKGRAASFSLALAVVLLMTAGAVNSYFESVINTADQTYDYDISISYGFSGIYEQETTQQVYQNLDAFVQKVLTSVADVEGTTQDGWMYYTDVDLKIPEAMVGETSLERNDNYFEPFGYVLADGMYGAYGTLTYLPRDAFDEFCRQNNIDPSLVSSNKGDMQAVMVANQRLVTANAYVMAQTITQPGTIDIVTGATLNGQEAEGLALKQNEQDETQSSFSGAYEHLEKGVFAPYVSAKDDTIVDADLSHDKIALTTQPVEIVALAHTVTSPMSLASPYNIVVPFEEDTLVPCSVASSDHMNFVAGYNATDHVSAAAEIDTRINALQKTLTEQQDPLFADLTFYSINDYKEQQESIKALVLVVNVFCLLFTVILLLIALANVFNTITNGLILRRREFAVMKSIGMSDKQFNRMIVSECIGYGLRGFIPGIIVAAGICWLFSVVVTQAMRGIGYLFPWTYLWLALVLVALALAMSAFFGLRKAKSGNVVEALRDNE